MTEPIVRDVLGRVRSWAWLRSVYGDGVRHLADANAEFGLHEVWGMCDPNAGIAEDGAAPMADATAVKLFPFVDRVVLRTRETVDPGAVIVVRIEDENGAPMRQVAVARWWDDPGLNTLPPALATWHDRGVIGWTNDNGDTGFGMGRGDYYTEDRPAVSAVWPEHGEGLAGIGMVEATSHWTVWPVFRRRSPDVLPPEPPVPGELTEEQRDIIAGAVLRMREDAAERRGAAAQMRIAAAMSDEAAARLDGAADELGALL